MYEQLNQLQESADISFPTKAHLDRMYLELQVRIQEAENSITTFYFDDAHFAQEDMPATLRGASDRFRKFLRQFYEKEYQHWPIRRAQPGLWLDRHVVSRLQQDFSALYEYNVNRNVKWNESEENNDRERRNLLKSVNALTFGLDGDDVRMLGIFQNIDCRLNTSNIPHPYPLLPSTVPAPPPTKASVFRGKKKDKVRESRIAHAYAEASNAFRLSREFSQNALVEAFVGFEKADLPSEVDPREARRERWIIMYCVLQTLGGISVDVPNLSFKGEVAYFLNARLQGFPPWCPTEKTFKDASREQSHCWTTSETWADDSYERRAPPKRFHSSAKSVETYQDRPLSPESQCSSVAFFESNYHSPIGESEANETFHRGYDSPITPITEPSSSSVRSLPPEYRLVPAKFAATAGISQYSTKVLPLRPGQQPSRDPEPRRPRR